MDGLTLDKLNANGIKEYEKQDKIYYQKYSKMLSKANLFYNESRKKTISKLLNDKKFCK